MKGIFGTRNPSPARQAVLSAGVTECWPTSVEIYSAHSDYLPSSRVLRMFEDVIGEVMGPGRGFA